MLDFFKDRLHEFALPLINPVLVFSLILFIILLAPILMRRLNLPGIIGLIVSGIIIGPFGLNILEKNSAVELFSTIGLLYIMFIAGLELDMNEFKKNQHKSLVFGFFTFIIPMAIGFPICHYLLNYDTNASLMVASMFATHTLVAYPIVSRLGISRNQAVAVTVGGTILTDTAVLVFLAIIMSSSQGNLNHDFWLRLVISFIVFSAIMFYIIPKITRWFFQKLESEKHAHYIFVLSVVFFSAFLAELSGLEPIIGAFMAGLALNRLIPQSSALMNRIEFIGNSLFIPFFLVSVGMLVDVRVILSGPMAMIIAGVLTIGAILGKWLAALFTQIIFKYSKAQRQLIFGLSSAHAAAILAVVLVGYNAGILDENILNGTIILILVTCVIASLATEKASKKILLSEKNMNFSGNASNLKIDEHILLPIANLLNYEKLLELTLLVKDKQSVNPITVLSVVPNDAEAEINIVSARKKLEEFKKQGAEAEIKVNTIATIDFNPSSGIARISREIMADIIVLGWPKKTRIFEKLIGDTMYNSLISNIDKNVFICSIENQLLYQKRIVVITPPLAEKENGFDIWFQKISILSKELSIPVAHFGSNPTQIAMQHKINQMKMTTPIKFIDFDAWDDILVLAKQIHDDDLIVFISARKNAVSYFNFLDNMPDKLEKYFSDNSKLIIYPQQFNHFLSNNTVNTSDNFVRKNRTIETFGKKVLNLFKE